eukprot:tig00000836_g4703.t1
MGAGCSAVQDTPKAAPAQAKPPSAGILSRTASAGQLIGKKMSVVAQSIVSDPSLKYKTILQTAEGRGTMSTTLRVDPRHEKHETVVRERISMVITNPNWTAANMDASESVKATLDMLEVPRGQGQLLNAEVVPRGDGSFELSWVPERPGRYVARVWLDGDEAEGSKVMWTVVPDALDISRCSVDAPDDESIRTTAGEAISVVASLFDVQGNPRAYADGRDAARLSVDVAPSSSLPPAERAAAAKSAACRCEHIGANRYRLFFSASRAGEYAVFVRLAPEGGGAPRGLKGSPFSVTVAPGVPSAPHCATVVPPSDSQINAGDSFKVSVLLRDKYGNPCVAPVPAASLRLLTVGINVWPGALARSVLAKSSPPPLAVSPPPDEPKPEKEEEEEVPRPGRVSIGGTGMKAVAQALATTRQESEGAKAGGKAAHRGEDTGAEERLLDSWVEGSNPNGSVKPGKGGEVVLACKFERSGPMRVHATLGGAYVPNSVPLTVVAGVPSPELTCVEGPASGAGQSVAGEPCTIRIGLRDRFGNRVTAAGVPAGLLRTAVLPLSGAARIAELPVVTLGPDPAGGGGLVASFVPTAAGMYRVRIAVDLGAVQAPEGAAAAAPGSATPASPAAAGPPGSAAGPPSTAAGPPGTASGPPGTASGPPGTAGSVVTVRRGTAASRLGSQRRVRPPVRRVDELPDIQGSPVAWNVVAGPFQGLVLQGRGEGAGPGLTGAAAAWRRLANAVGCSKGRRGLAARIVAADAHGNPCAQSVNLEDLEVLVRPASEGWADGGAGAASPLQPREDVGKVELVELGADGGEKLAGGGGLFEAFVTPAAVGELSVLVRHKGEPLAGSPTPFRAVSGDLCERLCALEVPPECAAGAPLPARVHLKDELGMALVRVDAPPKVEVKVTGPGDADVYVEPARAVTGEISVLEATFEPRRFGSYFVRAFVNGVEVAGSGAEVKADIGPLYPPACMFFNKPKDGVPVIATAGRGDDSTTFSVLACDAAGNVRSGFEDEIEARVEGPGPVSAFVAEEVEGVHMVRLGVPVAGIYTVDFVFRDSTGRVPGCPFQMVVINAPLDGPGSLLSVDLPVRAGGVHALAAGGGFEALVTARDAWGNVRSDSDDASSLSLSVRPAGKPVGCAGEVRVPAEPLGRGVYRAVVPPITAAGMYDVSGETLSGSVGDRPTQLSVLPAEIDVHRCSVEEWLPQTVEAECVLQPGEAFAAVVALRDVYGNHRSAGGDEARVWLEIRGPDVGCVWPSIAHQGGGFYLVEARPAAPGSYTALVSVDGAPIGKARGFRCAAGERTAFETALATTVVLPEPGADPAAAEEWGVAEDDAALVAVRWLRRPPGAPPRRLVLLVLECSTSEAGAWAGLRDALGPAIRKLYAAPHVRARVIVFGSPAGPQPFSMGRYAKAEDLIAELSTMVPEEFIRNGPGGDGPCFFELALHLQNAMRAAVDEEAEALGGKGQWELSYVTCFYGEHACKKLRHNRQSVAEMVRSLQTVATACGAARTSAHLVGVGPRFDSEIAEGTAAALETLAGAIAGGTSEYIAQVHARVDGVETLLCGVPLCGSGILSGYCAVPRAAADAALRNHGASLTVAVTTKMGRVVAPARNSRPRVVRLGATAAEAARLYAALRSLGEEIGRAGVANSAGRLDRERWSASLEHAAATAHALSAGSLLGPGPLEEWLEARAALLRALLSAWAPASEAFRAACFNLTVGADLDAYSLHARLSHAAGAPL